MRILENMVCLMTTLASMLLFYGKYHEKQFIRSKPMRFVYKNWVVCFSNGYMFGFQIYTGKSSNKIKLFGLSVDEVLSLLDQIQLHFSAGYKIQMHKYFTGLYICVYLTDKNNVSLVQYQKTAQSNAQFKPKKEWNAQPRGHFKFYRKDNNIVVHWKDIKVDFTHLIGFDCSRDVAYFV